MSVCLKRRNKKIINEYQLGKPVLKLSEEHGITKQGIYAILKNAEINIISNNKKARKEEIIHEFKQGINIETIAKKIGIDKISVEAILVGEKLINSPYNYSTLLERNKIIVEKYKKGIPMTEIGILFDLTRQGIQLILKKENIDLKNGGASKRAINKNNKINKQIKNNQKKTCEDKWGCTIEQWQLLRDMHEEFQKTPIARFIQHRSNAKREKIKWNLSLWDWWEFWNLSGKYTERGRGPGKFCMSRKDWSKPYQKGNLVIMKIINNNKKIKI